MRHRWAHAERDFIDIIDGRQSARIKFAKDHALGQSFNAAEIKPSRKLLQSPADQTLVARTDRRESIPQNNPIGRCLIEVAPAARRLHHLGIVAGAGDLERPGIDGAKHIQIHETVIQRRDQGIGQ